MDETVRKAQEAANKAQAPMYVFRAVNINGHELVQCDRQEKFSEG